MFNSYPSKEGRVHTLSDNIVGQPVIREDEETK